MSAEATLAAAARRGLAALALALSGCAGPLFPPDAAPARPEAVPGADLLGYHQQLQALALPELELERALLAAEPLTPEGRVRLAMALGQPRGASNPGRAQALLEGVLRSNQAEAAGLQPLARLLAGHYQEEQRSVAAIDRLGQEIGKLNQQIRSNQLRVELLQQKLDALAHIENTLPILPTAPVGRK